MKFIRYGSLAPQRAVHWRSDTIYYNAPPTLRGIYAMPYGFADHEWFVEDGLATDPSPRVRYIRDENGRKLFYDEIHELHDKKLEAFLKKKYHIKGFYDIFSEPRPSWVMVMDDPSNPPRYTHDPFDTSLSPEQVESIPLDQKLHFLKGENGERIPFRDIFDSDSAWEAKRYWDDFTPLSWNEIDAVTFLERQSMKTMDSPFRRASVRLDEMWDKKKQAREAKQVVQKWLEAKGIRLEQLCPWPIYTKDRSDWAIIRNAPHVFEYSGPIWHQMEAYVQSNKILQRSGWWVLTDIGPFEEALRKYNHRDLGKALRGERHSKSESSSWRGGMKSTANFDGADNYRRISKTTGSVWFVGDGPERDYLRGIQVFIDGKLNESKRK